MYSDLPKVLHRLAGKTLVGHVIDTARSVSPQDPIVVYGHGGEQLRAAFDGDTIVWVEQREQLGTGHAVGQALPNMPADGMALILYGDVPLLRSATLRDLVAAAEQTGFALLTVTLDDPSGYGRIVRDPDGAIARIVEEYGPRRTVFIDDLSQHHSSAREHAPDIFRLHLCGEPGLAPHIACGEKAGDAHARIDNWRDALPWILDRLEEPA